MSAVTLTFIGVAVTACLGLLGVWINDRSSMRGLVAASNQALVDQLQEERQEIKLDLRRLKAKVDGLILERRYWEDYVNELRSHIEQKKAPPPPHYPAGLLRIASEGLSPNA